MKLYEVAGRPDLKKDADSGMIYFDNSEKIRRYNALKERNKNKNEMQDEINQLKNDVGDIKTLLEKLINK